MPLPRNDENRHTIKGGILSWRSTMLKSRCPHAWVSLNKFTNEENLIKQPDGNIPNMLVIVGN